MSPACTFLMCHLTCFQNAYFLCVTLQVLFTHHTVPIFRPPRHYLITPVTFLVLVCAQNSCGHHGSCLQSSFTCIVKKFRSPSWFTDLESCHHQLNLGAATMRQQDGSPWGRPRWNPKLLELITLWCWKQTHKRHKILTRQFFLIKRVQACAHSC
jgi:hypothetical protein